MIDYSERRADPNWPTDEDESYADSVLRARYYRTVRRMAADYVKELNAGEYESAEDFDDRLREDIDGCQDVIYTRRAETVRYVSEYRWEDEAEDMGLEHPTAEQAAYICLLGEVREAVESELGESVDDWFFNHAKCHTCEAIIPEGEEYCNDPECKPECPTE